VPKIREEAAMKDRTANIIMKYMVPAVILTLFGAVVVLAFSIPDEKKHEFGVVSTKEDIECERCMRECGGPFYEAQMAECENIAREFRLEAGQSHLQRADCYHELDLLFHPEDSERSISHEHERDERVKDILDSMEKK
jgi:hypothetical protein